MKTALIALAMTGAVLTGTPAAAEGVSITYKDLDLTTPQGQKALQHRINVAARKVCGVGDVITGTRIVPAEVKACYAQALTSANTQFAAILAGRQLAQLSR